MTEPPQVISLSDSNKITFLGITYGRHHVAPNFAAIGGQVEKGHWINRSNDVAVAWLEIEHDPAHFPNYSLFVSDTADASAIGFREDRKSINHVRKGVEVEGFELGAYPRWEKQFYLRIYSVAFFSSSQRLSSEKFLATNPDLKDIGNAVAETLPVTKTNGDLTVTLTNFVSGAPQPPYLRDDRILPLDPVRRPTPAPDDPVTQCVRFGFDLRQNGHTASDWQLAAVTVSDAVGNFVETATHFQDLEDARHRYPFVMTPADDYKGYVFWPALWPHEPAWNVRMEFTNDDEILTLTNLPVRQGSQKDFNQERTWEAGKSNLSMVEYTVNGVTLKLLPPLLVLDERITDGARMGILIQPNLGNASERLRVSLLQATDENGTDLGSGYLSAGDNYFYDFTFLHEITSLNLKFALHRSRYVTFTVKPNRQ